MDLFTTCNAGCCTCQDDFPYVREFTYSSLVIYKFDSYLMSPLNADMPHVWFQLAPSLLQACGKLSVSMESLFFISYMLQVFL